MGSNSIDIPKIATGLRHSTERLCSLSRRLFGLQLFIVVFPIALVGIIGIVALFIDIKPSLPFFLILYYFVFFLCLYPGMRQYYHLKSFYDRIRNECGSLTDSIDWTIMRKKQLYGKLDEAIQKPIDEFYEYSSSRLCPFFGGKARFVTRNIIMIFEFVSISFVAVLVLSNVIHWF